MKKAVQPVWFLAVLAACGQVNGGESADDESLGTTDQALHHEAGGEWAPPSGRDTVYQAGTFDDLATSHFTGEVPFREVARHGDFGIGTMGHVDGEMIAIDGTFYSIKDDLVPRKVDPRTPTPFAQVTFFRGDRAASLASLTGLPAVQAALDGLAPDLRTFHAFKIEGTFATLKIRSIHRQEEPYPPISQVIATQVTRDLTNVRGTVIGFRTPAWAGQTAFANYHFHFINADRTVAGHLLDIGTSADATVKIDDKHALQLNLLGSDNDRGRH